jgi:hypothetical protein
MKPRALRSFVQTGVRRAAACLCRQDAAAEGVSSHGDHFGVDEPYRPGCGICPIDQSHLCRLFRQAFGQTPASCVANARFRKNSLRSRSMHEGRNILRIAPIESSIDRRPWRKGPRAAPCGARATDLLVRLVENANKIAAGWGQRTVAELKRRHRRRSISENRCRLLPPTGSISILDFF